MPSKRSKMRFKPVILVGCIVCASIIGLLYYSTGFTYNFNNTQVKFPLTVGQAIKAYGVLPHQYNRTGVAYTLPCAPNVPMNSVSEVFYIDHVDDFIKPPLDSLSKDIYAVKFCFAQQSSSRFETMKKQLERDFGGKFALRYNSYTQEPYYRLDAAHNVIILIEFYPEFANAFDPDKVKNPRSWAVSFCYNKFDFSVDHFLQYERNYNAE